jgi:hypothetical protein
MFYANCVTHLIPYILTPVHNFLTLGTTDHRIGWKTRGAKEIPNVATRLLREGKNGWKGYLADTDERQMGQDAFFVCTDWYKYW